MDNVRCSVIVPVYNVEKYLNQCIKSILDQSFKSFELILVDDGSTDSSGALCDQWAILDDRIVVKHQENGGQIKARKTGTELSNGEYIIFVDSDDYIESNLFSDLFSKIDMYSPDVVAFCYKRVDEEGVFLDRIENRIATGLYQTEKLDELRKRLVSDTSVKEFNMGAVIYGVASKVIRKGLLDECQDTIPESIVNGEDMAVTMTCVCKCNSLLVVEFDGYCYRQREGSMLHTFRMRDLDNYELLAEHLLRNLIDIPTENVYKFLNEVSIHQYCMALKNAESFSEYRAFLKTCNGRLSFINLKRVNLRNNTFYDWIRAIMIRERLWLFMKVYRLIAR